jgi:hypothetical protein
MAADPGTDSLDTCSDCGALVADADRHRAWHTELPRALSKAVIEYVDTHKS